MLDFIKSVKEDIKTKSFWVSIVREVILVTVFISLLTVCKFYILGA